MEAIRFKPQSESRFVSNPIAPGVGQINSGILTLSGSIHSRNLTITSIHKVGQTIPGIPGSDDSRNKWVRLFPEYMGELIPGIGGSEVSGIFIRCILAIANGYPLARHLRIAYRKKCIYTIEYLLPYHSFWSF
jgi:hypothetical protein